jgi:ArsR family transcriptional regulator
MTHSFADLLDGLRAAAEPSRLRLLALCAQGELTVGELVQIVGQSQPRVSRHLKLLCDAGLLDRQPEGNSVFYRLASGSRANGLVRQLADMLPVDDEQLRRDREGLDAVRKARAAQAAAYFDAAAESWDRIRALHVRDDAVERGLLEMLPAGNGRTLLDIGTGTGRILELFGARGTTCTGLDLSPAMLRVARANLARAGLADAHVRQGDMYRLPWSEPEFDAVTFHHVLHFADEPGRALAEAARVLKPGGRLVVVDFAPHDLETLRAEHAHRRLGFADSEMRGWMRAAALVPGRAASLPGARLTVCLWPADRPSAPEYSPNAKERDR